MGTTVEAVFDGSVLRPDEPLELPANTHVTITIEAPAVAQRAPYSFLETALSLKLDGPPDWSTNLEAYLYGDDVAAPD